jgi:prophage regulatory protein
VFCNSCEKPFRIFFSVAGIEKLHTPQQQRTNPHMNTQHPGTTAPLAAAVGVTLPPSMRAEQVQSVQPQAFYRLREVERLTGKRKTAIYDAMKARTFPAPVRIGSKAVAWRAADIAAWQAALPLGGVGTGTAKGA